MKVKKYTAPTMRDALEKMKRELGTSAVILGSRKISRGGLLDFLGHELFEVTATTEEHVLTERRPRKSSPAPPPRAGARLSVTVGDSGPVRDPAPAAFASLLPPTAAVNGGGTAAIAVRSATLPAPADSAMGQFGLTTGGVQVRRLEREIDDLKTLLAELAEQMRYRHMPALPGSLKEIYRRLVDNELEEKITLELIQRLYGRFSEEQYSNPERVEQYLIREIAAMIPVAPPTPVREGSPLVIAFTGPTGVGKTTTLAKLATNVRFYGNHRVAMVTADTYRVAATQQLGTFSEIADIPLEVVHSPRDMARALHRHRDKQVILVDTPGASQFNERLLEELRKVIAEADPDEVHLVLSAATKPKDLLHAVKAYRVGKSMRLLLTKFDETLTFGSIVSVVRETGLPLSYISFGQEVPEDLEAAQAERIARLAVKNIF